MATITTELVGSREGTQGQSPSYVLRYDITGTDDDVLVRALAASASPTSYQDLFRQNIRTKQEGAEYWVADVEYGPGKEGKPGQMEWSLEIAGGASTHISTSLARVAQFVPAGKPLLDIKQGINVRRDANGRAVDGLDIDVTTFAWSETHYFAYDQITAAYRATLFALRGKVNNAAWRNYAKGEVRFVGLSASPKGEDTVPLVFRFEATPSVQGLTIGNINNINKEGWQYLWVYFHDEEDLGGKDLVKNPRAVFIEKVYDYGDFSELGIGDPFPA